MENSTKNQHFISQSEQRNNCIDEGASRDKKRIFQFSIVDREEHSIRLTRPDGVKIKYNLSFGDLFSFDVTGDQLRKNLEDFFYRYEVSLGKFSKELVTAAQNNAGVAIVTELASEVLKSKLMGVIRNPFCIVRTLDMFKPFLGYHPTDPELLYVFKSLRDGNKPHVEKVCLEFRVTPDQYLDWLQVIFFSLMTPPGSGVSMLESMVEGLMASPGRMCHLILSTYDDVEGLRVALPDTGYLQGTQDPYNNMFLFNLNKKAFASFSFLDLAKQTLVPIPSVLRDRVASLGMGFTYQIHHNNLQVLERFNALAVYQSMHHVYCADNSILGVKVLD